jgi:hypothetical protein
MRSSLSAEFGLDDEDDFGTVGGFHTVAELKDFIAAKDYQIAQTEKVAFDPAIVARLTAGDISQQVKWANDWGAMKTRYNAVRGPAMLKVSAASVVPIPNNTIPAEPEYQAVFKAVRQSGIDGQQTPGDLLELMGRLGKLPMDPAAPAIKVDESGIPQPTAPDLDQQLRNAALAATGAVTDPIDAFLNKHKVAIVTVAGALTIASIASFAKSLRSL